ncbi:MAG: 50S ribosomal protein L35 [Chloroflexi bacterium]|nr:50S ribosomal protein L35 [Chloroflexota bacterium]MBU1747663.1 50S ribosomal protein L35 [Chloroflexota bacterium]MBU1877615.1 50S ribosomal protein L35 [Chloroflexota bacterium]
MPKIKTYKSAAKRLKITGTGKIHRTKVGKSHLRRKKSKRVKRLFSITIEVSPANRKRIRRLVPYGTKR